jgi:starch synthase
MRVLAIASEMQPWVKTGGLADVVGALPAALAVHRVAVTTLIPGYPALRPFMSQGRHLHHFDDLVGVEADLIAAEIGGRHLLLLDAPELYDREGGPYTARDGRDWPDNWRRFAALGRAGADIAGGLTPAEGPDLLHVHDWQPGLAPAYLRHGPRPDLPSVLTLHNLAFQGRFDAGIFAELGLPDSAFQLEGVEYFGGVGFLKAGMHYCQMITTVSPSYAQEILRPQQGMGLDGLLKRKPLRGIINGIDHSLWDPTSDAQITAHYSSSRLGPRKINKQAVAKVFHLGRGAGPIFSVISRLTAQKGIDVLVEAIPALIAAGGRLAVLGAGDLSLEQALLRLAAQYPQRIGVKIGYDEGMAHLLQAGADAILIPSRFEPCGLTQIYGLRYGCLPIVARTGGLNDTVIDANEAALTAGVATGFQFWPPESPELLHAISRALTLYADKRAWVAMQRRAMRVDFSWDRSARLYARLFADLVGGSPAARVQPS